MINLPFIHTHKEVLLLPIEHKPLLYLTLKHLPLSFFRTNTSIALNFLLKDYVTQNHFSEITNKWINIHITDIDINLYIAVRRQFIDVSSTRQNEDAKISLSLESVIDLICQKSDPDTLFFNRELTLSGNTETSLALKNILDSIDIDEITPDWIKKVTSLCHKGEMDRSSL